MNPLVLSMHLAKKGASQYTGFPFDSVAVFNGQLLAAGPSGIFTLEGETDHGEPIGAWVELPPHETGRMFRPACFHLICSGGEMELTATVGDEAQAYALPEGLRREAKGERVVPGAQMTLKIANVNGADFTLENLDVTLTEHGRRP